MEGEIKDHQWDDISKLETETVPLIDPGIGKEVILRHFFFKSQPRPKNVPAPTQLQIVSQFKKMIELSLWGDGLIIREDKPLEVHSLQKARKISKSLHTKMVEEGADFVIMCLATPRMGMSVNDHVHKVK